MGGVESMGQGKGEQHSEKNPWNKEGSFQMGQAACRLQVREQAEDSTQLTSEGPPDEQLLLLMVPVATGTVFLFLASAPAFFSRTLAIYFTGIC